MWRLAVILILVNSTACGDDDGPPVGGDGGREDGAAGRDATPAVDGAPVPDAWQPDLACAGDEPPTTAPDPIALGGAIVADDPEGILVELRARDDDAVLATATTGADGAFTLSVPTGGVPLAAYVRVSRAGSPPTHRYYARPLADDDDDLAIALWSAEDLTTLASWVGETNNPARGTLLVDVRDCAGALLPDARATITPAVTSTWYSGAQQPFCYPQWGYEATTDCGVLYGFNLPVRSYSVGFAYGGDDLAPTDFDSAAGALSVVTVAP